MMFYAKGQGVCPRKSNNLSFLMYFSGIFNIDILTEKNMW